LSAANEVAVEAFLTRRLGFIGIAVLVEQVMDRLGTPGADSLAAVVELDATARRLASQLAALAA
jgi:1-deoxy-D-xylulose-5-phosphate reductoisomerase